MAISRAYFSKGWSLNILYYYSRWFIHPFQISNAGQSELTRESVGKNIILTRRQMKNKNKKQNKKYLQEDTWKENCSTSLYSS